MSFERVENTQKIVKAFALAAKEDVDAGAVLFQNYVGLLGGRFDLAVANVGDVLFGRIIGCEQSITKEEEGDCPNVREAISKARQAINPAPMANCN